MNNLIIFDYNVESYKNEIQEFFIKIKGLFLEINDLNKKKELINNLFPKIIKNEYDLKENKLYIDTINNLFKKLEIYNNDIKKILNNWKSHFAGVNGLDQHIKELKAELIKPFKDEQLKYDYLIQEKITKEEITLKEQSKIKTTIGIRTYKEIIIDEINVELLERKYIIPNELIIKADIKADNNINIRGVKYHIEVVKK